GIIGVMGDKPTRNMGAVDTQEPRTRATQVPDEPANGQEPPAARPAARAGFLKHTFVYGLGSIVTQAISFFLLPLYTHYLTPSDLGIIEIITRAGQYLMVVLLVNGLRVATLTFFRQAKTPAERSSYVTTLTLVLWLIIAATGCVGGYFAPEFSRSLKID